MALDTSTTTPGAQSLPLATPNSATPIAQGEVDAATDGTLVDEQGKPITGTLNIALSVTAAWRYLFGTFVQRSPSISTTFSLTAGVSYDQPTLQALIAQVELLSKAVGNGE
jgi:hypothetical protein